MGILRSQEGSQGLMPIMVDNEEYYSVEEACAYLGDISRETLRRRAQEHGIKKYARGVRRNVYYKKVDLDKLNEFRPIDEDRT